MNKKISITGCLIVFVSLILSYQIALAHETVTVGDYELEIGWVDEPPVAGQKNAILISVLNTSTGEPVDELPSLTVTVSYGGQEKQLTLQPMGEDTPGQFVAPLLPTIPGQYTVLFGGQLGDTPIDAHVEPEEVEAADTLQFPSVEPAVEDRGGEWLSWLAVFLGLVGAVLGTTALLRKPRQSKSQGQ